MLCSGRCSSVKLHPVPDTLLLSPDPGFLSSLLSAAIPFNTLHTGQTAEGRPHAAPSGFVIPIKKNKEQHFQFRSQVSCP